MLNHRNFKEKRKKITLHWAFQLSYTVVKIGPLKQEKQEE